MSVVAAVPVLGQVHVLTKQGDSVRLKCIEYKEVGTETVREIKPNSLIRYSCKNYFVDEYIFYIAYIVNADKMTSREITSAISRLRVQPIELTHYWTTFKAISESI